MITIIRNDHQARFAHDCYGVKIKEDKPNYKIIATLNNEGLCVYESPNYAEVADTFNIIIQAIVNGDKCVFLHPPVRPERMTKDEFDDSMIHDFCNYGTAEKRELPPQDCDLYGRPLNKMKKDLLGDVPEELKGWYRPSKAYSQDFYAHQNNQEFDGYNGRTFNNRYFDNNYPNPTRDINNGEPII